MGMDASRVYQIAERKYQPCHIGNFCSIYSIPLEHQPQDGA
jgi:hypothetical protein